MPRRDPDAAFAADTRLHGRVRRAAGRDKRGVLTGCSPISSMPTSRANLSELTTGLHGYLRFGDPSAGGGLRRRRIRRRPRSLKRRHGITRCSTRTRVNCLFSPMRSRPLGLEFTSARGAPVSRSAAHLRRAHRLRKASPLEQRADARATAAATCCRWACPSRRWIARWSGFSFCSSPACRRG